jgi:hypothetical protein
LIEAEVTKITPKHETRGQSMSIIVVAVAIQRKMGSSDVNEHDKNSAHYLNLGCAGV